LVEDLKIGEGEELILQLAFNHKVQEEEEGVVEGEEEQVNFVVMVLSA
jgi:hypothetical protein